MASFLPLFESSLTSFWTQIFFLSSNGIISVFKTSLSSYSFATKQLRVSQVTPIFLSRCTKSKHTIFTFSDQSMKIWKLICWTLINVLFSSAFQKFSMHQKHTYYSIPLNPPLTLRYCRMAQKCRMNMIETVLESSWSPLSENIYIIGSISYSFL